MALRIARGLVRLWLVLTVLWIGGVATVTWLEFSAVGPWDVVYETPATNPESTTINVRSPDGIVHVFPAGTASDVIDRVMKDYWRSQVNMALAAKVALIPPALVLVLGSALGWAFRGFR